MMASLKIAYLAPSNPVCVPPLKSFVASGAPPTPRRTTSSNKKHNKHHLPLESLVLAGWGRPWRVDYVGVIKGKAGGSAVSTPFGTEWLQRMVELPPYRRGCHIITQHIYKAVPEINKFQVGLVNLFVMHTSASLTINENASSDVPLDMEDALNRIVPEGNQYRHRDEGFDDMPAHVKASMMGCSLTIPIKEGRLNLGIWQGIWLNEHRNCGGPRKLCVTIQGVTR